MNFYLFLLLGVFVVGVACQSAGQCVDGDEKLDDCNRCHCSNGLWACTRKLCIQKTARITRDAPQCSDGDEKKDDCNRCRCLNGNWACTKKHCIPKERKTRGAVPVAADLKSTPCAPNDYFTIDCNTCYCNIEQSGYLCTENLCPSVTDDAQSSPANATLIINGTTLATPLVTAVTEAIASTDNVTVHSNQNVITSTNQSVTEQNITNSNQNETLISILPGGSNVTETSQIGVIEIDSKPGLGSTRKVNSTLVV